MFIEFASPATCMVRHSKGNLLSSRQVRNFQTCQGCRDLRGPLL